MSQPFLAGFFLSINYAKINPSLSFEVGHNVSNHLHDYGKHKRRSQIHSGIQNPYPRVGDTDSVLAVSAQAARTAHAADSDFAVNPWPACSAFASIFSNSGDLDPDSIASESAKTSRTSGFAVFSFASNPWPSCSSFPAVLSYSCNLDSNPIAASFTRTAGGSRVFTACFPCDIRHHDFTVDRLILEWQPSMVLE
jgi:hypothetical protein